jgi:outer membrane protein W
MRKLFITALMLTGFAFSTQAQEKNAIGIRLGDNSGFGGEVSFQTALSKKNRLELDLGFRNEGNVYYGGYGNNYYGNGKGYGHNDVKLVGIYQWVFDIKNGFKWYVGPGVGAGIYSSKNYYNPVINQYETKNGAFAVIAGDVGVEYNFKFPLQLSFDIRPEIYLSPDYTAARDNSFGPDLGLSARYRF